MRPGDDATGARFERWTRELKESNNPVEGIVNAVKKHTAIDT